MSPCGKKGHLHTCLLKEVHAQLSSISTMITMPLSKDMQTEQQPEYDVRLGPQILELVGESKAHLPRGLSLRWGLRERERLPSFFLYRPNKSFRNPLLPEHTTSGVALRHRTGIKLPLPGARNHL